MDERILQLSADFILHQMDGASGGSFLFSLTDGKIFRLNKISYTMIEAFDGRRTVDEILRSLLVRYDEEPGRVESDFSMLVKQWEKQGILSECKGGDATA